MKALFANRFVQSILLSGLFLQLGIWIRNFAVLLFVTEQTDKDPVAISLISVAEFAPIFLFSFVGGAFADRWRPKLTMVACDLLGALSVFGVLLALVYGGWEAIFFATLISSVLSQFSQPSGMKLFKQHVPAAHMQAGMSMYQTTMAMFMVLGPMLGTLIYYKLGINASVAIVGACFLLSAAVLTSLPADKKNEADSRDTSLGREMKMGLHYVAANKIFVYMGGFFLVCGLGMGMVNPLGIFLVTDNLGLTSEDLQWFTAVNGVGMLVGGGMAMGLSRRITPQAMLLIGFVLCAIATAALGSVKVVGAAIAAQFVAGMMGPFIHIAINTLVLTHSEEAYVGRVNGILNPLFTGAMVLNMSLIGIWKSVLPLGTIYAIAAGLYAVGAVAMPPLFKIRQARASGKNPKLV